MAYLTGQVLTQADLAALFASGTYTPTLANMAIGTGGTPTNTAKYTFVGFPAGGVLTVEGMIKFGTTAPTLPGASAETVSLPSGYSMITTNVNSEILATVAYYDSSLAALMAGALYVASATTVGFHSLLVSGTAIQLNNALSATAPITWAINDEIHYRFSARCTGP